MGFRSLVLLAFAVGGGALEIDINYVGSVTQDFHEYFSSSLRALVHEHANPKQTTFPVIPHFKNETCGECVRFGAKYLLEKTVDKMKNMCANASNSANACVAQKVCGMMAKHNNMTLGMMIEHVRPMSLATAYCYGKGSCKKPDDMTMSEIASGHEPHEALLDNFDKIDWSEVQEETEMLMPPHDDEEMGEEKKPTCAVNKRMHKVSPRCMRHKMHKMMHMAAKKVKGMCAHADQIKCPVMQKMCPWMGQHKEVAFGMLAAKVEPWKFAMGACFHHGHHGHHHGRHHGHHHGDHHHGHHDGHHHGPHHGHHGEHHHGHHGGWWQQEEASETIV